MSESLVFHSQTKLILETVIKCALDLMAGFANENQSTEAGFNKMVELLAQEASRKINSVFLQLSDATNKEKLTLRDKVSKLESRLTAVTEDLDGIKIWRENVMSGCPVLNEQTGWVLTLKPFGMLVKSADESTKEDGNFVTPAGGRHIKEFTLEEANCGDVSSAWKQDIAEDDKMTPSSDSQNPLPAEVSKVFECDVCKKRFSRQLHLRRHLDTHKESLSCHQCSRTFRSSAMLERHLLRHNEKTPQSFACPLCDQTFKSKKLLKSHESVHGDDVRPFACDQFLQGKAFTCETCGAGFTLRQNLKRHNRIHTGERPFKCHVCGASFIQDKLKAHMLIHGASKSFMCDLCGKTFLYNCQLKKHQKLLHQDGTEAGTQAGRRRARVRGNRTIIFKRDRVAGVLEPIPAIFRREAGYTLNWSAANRRAHRNKQPFVLTFTPTGNLESSINLSHMFLACGKKPENPEKTHEGTWRTCKLHKGAARV
ncbi:zinc finger protein 28-like isoform X2 [Phyllopteryx taeniolatus]|uniref:zinc finger protein 28-like isoform X2 n=1 Tax=Phyllopteryx taeniolatus TaxID=161469 RepID=UPI002AD27975|nr:zinc finger protein 28-like isoform X2 [Phyllopteryx taeniolatus]